MPGAKSPFVNKSIVCPLCRKGTRQRFFRQRMFMPEVKESDQHVTAYKWLVNDVRRVHPPYYGVIHCPYCRYTDMADDFEGAANTPSFPEVVRGIRHERLDKVVVQLLGDVINYQDIDFQSALNLHLLAILFQQLAAEDLQDTYKIARLYLRVAWLYRERASGQGEVVGPEPEPELQVDQTPAIALGHLRAMKAGLKQIEGRMAQLRPLVQGRVREADCADPDAYSSALADLVGLFQIQAAALDKLEACCQRDVAGLAGARPGGQPRDAVEGPFVQHAPYMEKVKTLWPQAPLNESDAMAAAIAYYEKALTGDPRFGSFQSYVRVANLVADLMARRGDFDGAVAMAKSIYQTAAQARQTATTVLRGKDIDDRRRKQAESMAKRAAQAVEAAAELREQLDAKRAKNS